MKAAVYISTRRLYRDIEPSLKALLHNSDVDKVFLLLEDDEIGYWLPPQCEIRNISHLMPEFEGTPNFKNPWAWVVLLRSLYWRIFPDLDKVLSIDVDAFAIKDISHLWEIDISNYLLAAVRETSKLDKPDFPYYNAGVLMQNLDRLRTSGRGEDVAKALKRRKWAYPEQDAFNVICSGSVLELPREYNAGIGTEPYCDPYIRHFMGEQATYRNSEIYRYWKELPWEKV